MNKETLLFNQAMFKSMQFKQNSNSVYSTSSEDKTKILGILDEKYNETMLLSKELIGCKKLLYYSIYGADYLAIFELSLRSLIVNKQNNFYDLLLITDESTLKMLHTCVYLNEFNWNFYLTSAPKDAVEASMMKTKIYSYPNISNYNKILFLDVDIICKGNIEDVFEENTNGKLSVVTSPLMNREIALKPIKAAVLSHSLGVFTEKNKEDILKNNITVFNAGHFYFENTKQMEKHFENLNWLIEVWPGAYFYEQSFMNHYFNLNNLTLYSSLDKNVAVIMSMSESEGDSGKQHKDHHTLVHFAGATSKGRIKYRFIKNYCNNFNICL